MAYDIKWIIEKRVMLVRVWGDLGASDIEQVNGIMQAHLNEGQAPVHMVIDQAGLGKVGVSIGQFRGADTVFSHVNLGWVVALAAPNSAIRFLGQAVQLFRYKTHNADTIEAAIVYLREVDPTLANLPEADLI